MNRTIAARIFAAVTLLALVRTVDALPANAAPMAPVAPTGIRVSVFLSGLANPTSLAFGPDRRLYVGEESGYVFVQTRTGLQQVANGFGIILGIAWHKRVLYVSSTGEVSQLIPGKHFRHWTRRTIISGLPHGRHENDGIVFRKGWMYLGLGSTCDACAESDPRSATIMRYHLNGTHGQIYARGVRNPFGLAIQPSTGDLYATDNGRDDHDDHVPDELNRIVRGANYGWPGCWGHGQGPHCQGTTYPVALFPPHSSADGIVFDSGNGLGAHYRGDAFVAEYGDQLNSLGTGFDVQFVHFGRRVTLHTFSTGYGNPLAVTLSPNGSLLVADFSTGIVWRFHV